MPDKDIILFINNVSQDALESIRKYGRRRRKRFRIALIKNTKLSSVERDDDAKEKDIHIKLSCDFSSPLKISETLKPYLDRLFAVTSREEVNVASFAQVVPHIPYLRTPNSESLLWATDKLAMRQRLHLFDKKIVPEFEVVSSVSKKSLDELKSKIGFPLVLKPAGLASSLLVNICFHKEELEQSLRKIFRKIRKLYKDNNRQEKPHVLAEQFMEGEMYSVDVYVTSRGKIESCPLVHVKTGRQIGFDDFFGYQQITPTTLTKEKIQDAEAVATKAVHALGLRSSTVHIELMLTNHGWKVIELAPRIGGMRHKMYNLAFGIDHSLNDILIRVQRRTHIPKTVKGFVAFLKIYAKQEGVLTELKGVKKIEALTSFKEIKVNKKIGDMCRFAKHGDRAVIQLLLFNKQRSNLLADIRRVEQTVEIVTKSKTGK